MQFHYRLLLIITLVLQACSSSPDSSPTVDQSVSSSSNEDSNSGNQTQSSSQSSNRVVVGPMGPMGPVGPQGLPGPVGAEGQAGGNCWDDVGDANQDGVEDSKDCRFSRNVKLDSNTIYDYLGQFDLNERVDPIVIPEDAKSFSIALQSTYSSGRFCVPVNVKHMCGDEDGCKVFLIHSSFGDANGYQGIHKWDLIPQFGNMFFDPDNIDDEFALERAGVQYQAIYGGSHTRADGRGYAITGAPTAAKRLLAWSPNINVAIDNYDRSNCQNLSLITNAVHPEEHVLTLSVPQGLFGKVIIKD